MPQRRGDVAEIEPAGGGCELIGAGREGDQPHAAAGAPLNVGGGELGDHALGQVELDVFIDGGAGGLVIERVVNAELLVQIERGVCGGEGVVGLHREGAVLDGGGELAGDVRLLR